MSSSRAKSAPVAIPVIAGTAVTGAVGSVLLYRVLRRHPHAFIVSLEGLGLTKGIDGYQSRLDEAIQSGLNNLGLPVDTRLVVVGHSQGGLAAARYALGHPDRVWHTVTVGTPWGGLPVVSRLSSPRLFTALANLPALQDMRPASAFLERIHADLDLARTPVTNVYSASDMVIQPYQAGRLGLSHVRNVLLATPEQYREHLLGFPDFAADEVIFARRTHFDQMNCAEVRSIVWDVTDDASSAP